MNLASIIEKQHNEIATIESEEMGKCITEARGVVQKSADTCKFFAENLERFSQPRVENTFAKLS